MVRADFLLVLSLLAVGCSQAATTADTSAPSQASGVDPELYMVVTSAFASSASYVDATLDLGHLN